MMYLNQYTQGEYDIKASKLKQVLWYFIGSPLASSHLIPFSFFKVLVLTLFGSSFGKGVRIKPGVRVKFPWKLRVGEHSWIGEGVWIDNLADVEIGSNCCISQGAYLCTGSHDWSSPQFDLITNEIKIEDHAWIAAFSKVAPGTTVGKGAILSMGSVGSGKLKENTIYRGNPANPVKERYNRLHKD